jgi:hypothetical protein
VGLRKSTSLSGGDIINNRDAQTGKTVHGHTHGTGLYGHMWGKATGMTEKRHQPSRTGRTERHDPVEQGGQRDVTQ